MVDRKAVLTNLKNFYAWKFKNYPLNFDEAQVIIEALETETPHARWIDGEYDEHYKPIYMCSNCRSCYINRFRFCGTCGARMDGE